MNDGHTDTEPVPPYEIPAPGEAIRAYDGTRWGRAVPAVYLGFVHVSGDYFMHRVRSESGLENTLASHDVARLRLGPDGEHWEPLTAHPRVR